MYHKQIEKHTDKRRRLNISFFFTKQGNLRKFKGLEKNFEITKILPYVIYCDEFFTTDTNTREYVISWLSENCKGSWLSCQDEHRYLLFTNENDACLFKLWWESEFKEMCKKKVIL